MQSIARRRQLEDELKFLAEHDPLTGLFNRSRLAPALEAAAHIALAGRPGAVLYLDLDNFKIINDTLGHDSGDKLLLQVTAALKDNARSRDVLVRFGGDEFVFVLPDCSMTEAVGVAESLIARVEEIVFASEDRTFRVGVSIGATVIDGKKESGEVMGEADSACYAAKARGRNRVEVYRPDTSEISKLLADTDWTVRIRGAMRDGSLQLWFQPVVSLSERRLLFHEVLLRYVDPHLAEPVHPNVFLSAMRRFGQSTRLDRFVIARAFESLADDPGISLSINISGALFGDESYCDFVESMLGNSGIDPYRVFFEITENELIPNLQTASRAITRLQKLGCRFGLDDFGSGFSSLSYLKSLPIDFLKIEGSFIRDLPNQKVNQAALQAIRIIADVLDVRTIAEFVEQPEEAELLRQLGISYGQGHFIGRPRSTPYSLEELAILPPVATGVT